MDRPDEAHAEHVDGVDELTEKTEKVQVSTLVHQYLEAQNLGVLPERAMERAVEEFVEKGDKDALAKCVLLIVSRGQQSELMTLGCAACSRTR